MAAMSDYLENKFLDHFLGTSSTSAPAAVYVALFTSDPADDASGTEVSGSGYARQSMGFDAASSASASNTSAVTFPAASGGAWGTITHLGIFDASTSGNLLFHSSLTASKTISDGDIFKINAAGVTITAA
jgi:hypothetical protein|tara:strand:- start:182 stop:571 length:390 start_codon:yes stop_codon:yes gene_type:complete